MKQLAVALLALAPLFAHAQAPISAPKPKDNVVLIQTPDSAATALRNLAIVFVAQGYTINKLDKEFLTLLMEPKTLAHSYNPVLTIRAAASQQTASLLRLSGAYKASAGSIQVASPAEYMGSETGTNKTAFRELQKAALAYPGGQVSYAKE